MPESSYPSPNTHPVLILTQLISSELNMIIIITSHHPPSILQASSQHPSIILPASSQCPPSILPSSSQHPPITLPASSQHPPIIFPSSSQHPPSILPSSPQHPPSIVPSFSQYPPISDTTSQAPHLRLHISASTSQTSHLRIHIIVTIKCPMRTIQRRLAEPSATIHDWWWWMIINHFDFTIFLGGGEGLGIEEWPHACIITTIIIITIIFFTTIIITRFPRSPSSVFREAFPSL